MRKQQSSHLSIAVDTTELKIKTADNAPFIRAENLSIFYNGKTAVKNVSASCFGKINNGPYRAFGIGQIEFSSRSQPHDRPLSGMQCYRKHISR